MFVTKNVVPVETNSSGKQMVLVKIETSKKEGIFNNMSLVHPGRTPQPLPCQLLQLLLPLLVLDYGRAQLPLFQTSLLAAAAPPLVPVDVSCRCHVERRFSRVVVMAVPGLRASTMVAAWKRAGSSNSPSQKGKSDVS